MPSPSRFPFRPPFAALWLAAACFTTLVPRAPAQETESPAAPEASANSEDSPDTPASAVADPLAPADTEAGPNAPPPSLPLEEDPAPTNSATPAPVLSENDSLAAWDRLHAELAELRRHQDRIAGRTAWSLLALIVLVPTAFLWLGFAATRRLAGQQEELIRQRRRLDSVGEYLRALPENLPRPALDVRAVAEHLRQALDLPSSAAAASHPTPPASGTASPFFHDEHWLPRAVEGPRRYLDHLYQVRRALAEMHETLGTLTPPADEALHLAGWMLARFHANRHEGPEARWRHLLSVAEDTGHVVDLAISERLRLARTEEEAARTLHRALYRDVLEDSISQHLIILEEMAHLPTFCRTAASREHCQAVAAQGQTLIDTFLTETRRLAGYTPNHLPLFAEVSEEAAHFVRNNAAEELPPLYRNLDLPRRRVLYVLAYGLRRERGWENEETQVILS